MKVRIYLSIQSCGSSLSLGLGFESNPEPEPDTTHNKLSDSPFIPYARPSLPLGKTSVSESGKVSFHPCSNFDWQDISIQKTVERRGKEKESKASDMGREKGGVAEG